MICRRGVRVNVALAIALSSACTSRAPSPDLVVIAHPDDDMLFMQPDMYDVVHAGKPVVVVYVTAGNGGQGLDYVEKRYTAAKFAYASVAESNQWNCAWIQIRGHAAQRCKLDDRPVTLI